MTLTRTLILPPPNRLHLIQLHSHLSCVGAHVLGGGDSLVAHRVPELNLAGGGVHREAHRQTRSAQGGVHEEEYRERGTPGGVHWEVHIGKYNGRSTLGGVHWEVHRGEYTGRSTLGGVHTGKYTVGSTQGEEYKERNGGRGVQQEEHTGRSTQGGANRVQERNLAAVALCIGHNLVNAVLEEVVDTLGGLALEGLWLDGGHTQGLRHIGAR